MNSVVRTLIGFVVAVLLTYVFGAIFVSQGNLAQVAALGADVGIEVTFADRVDAAIHDLTNMTGLYLPLVAVGLVIALPVARLVIGFLPHLRLIGYTLSGFVAMIALHAIMEAVLGINGVAPTRFLDGLLLQGVAGGVGGLAFHYVTQAGTRTA